MTRGGRVARAVIAASTIAVLLSLSVLFGDASAAAAPDRSPQRGSLPILWEPASDWIDMSPTVSPHWIENFPMVYDSLADRMVLFGGYDGIRDGDGVIGNGSDQTWAYDFESNEWSNLAPPVHPDAGWTHRAAFDSWAGRMIMFGGYDGVTQTYTNQTWAFDFFNNTWTDLRPAVHPSARSRQGMAFDVQSGRTIIFGGHTIENRYSNETWAYSSSWNTWVNMTSGVAPSGRRSPGMVYDPVADRMILFGGFDGNSEFNDTWSYDFETNAWTNLSPPAAPSPRWSPGFAYDPEINRCILFGGTGGPNETWAYDVANNSWDRFLPEHSPPGRAFAGMAYDTQSARVILFSGDGSNDTWAFTTDPSAPLAPLGLTATSGDGSISLTWRPPSSDGLSPITGYRVYRGPDAQNVSLIADLGDVYSYVDSNVSNGVTYAYRVSAVNVIGEGPLSEPVSATPDGEPPMTAAEISGTPGRNGWFTSLAVKATLTATDDISGVASTSYRIDGGPWWTYSNPFYVAHDGIHAVDFYSVDNAGNIEPTQTVYPAIDSTPPTSRAVLNGSAVDSHWFRSNVTASIEASDATSGVASIAYRLDGGEWQVYAASFEIGEGTHVLDSYATDVAGLSEDLHSVPFGVDTTHPSAGVVVSGPRGDDSWYLGSVQVAINASDPTSPVTVSYRLDAHAWLPYGGPFAVTGTGVHTVEYMAVDAVGNSAYGSASISIDASPPRSQMHLTGTPGSGVWYTSPVTVTLAAEDYGSGAAGMRYRLDDGPWQTYDGGTIAVDGDGAHILEFYAWDVAGNTEPAQSETIYIDTVAPSSAATLSGVAGDHGWYRSSVEVELRADDATSGVASLRYRIDEAPWASYVGAFVVVSGVHTILFAASDAAGLEEMPQSAVVRVDTAPPSLGDLRPSGHFTRSDVTVTWSSSDDVSGIDRFEVSVDGGGWTAIGVEPEAGLRLSDGTHSISVRAVDVAGNAAEASLDVTIDTNVFSLGGPYGGVPTFGVLVIAIAVLALAVRRRRRRA